MYGGADAVEATAVIRFAYINDTIHPKQLHRLFLVAGARPHLYSYRPRLDLWTLVMENVTEAMAVRDVLSNLGIEHDEMFVTSKFD